MRPRVDSQLNDLLRDQARTLGEEALEPGAQIATEKLDRLERLARLTEIVKTALEPPRKRWPVLLLFGITLTLVSILLFARVPQTDIDADLVVSALSFSSPSQQVLLNLTQSVSLGVSGLKSITLPQTHFQPGSAASDPVTGSSGAVRFSVESSKAHSGIVALDPFAVSSGTRLRLRTTELPNQVRLSLKGKDLVFRVNVSGSVSVAEAGEPVRQFDFPVPVPVVLRGGDEEIPFDIEFGTAPFALEPQLSVSDLSFLETEQFVDDRRTILQNRSTILSGAVFFESLGDRSKTLRPGEVLRFTGLRGEIRTLKWHDRQLALRFHGTVNGITSGPGEHAKNLMPSWLEWLQARHGLALLWAAALYFFGLIFGALRWWKGDI